jgi:hypothetical protein
MGKRNLIISGRKRPKRSSPSSVNFNKLIRIILYVINGLFAVVGIIIILTSTAVYGPGITTDAAHYLSSAENLLAGQGYTSFNGIPYVHWPPLFPSLIALISLLGIEPYAAGRFINAFSFGGIIFLSGMLFNRRIKSFWLTISATLAVLLSTALLKDCAYLWSEPVFILLIIMYMFCITQYLEKERLRFLILAAVFASLSCLQRYAGLTTVITGGILTLFLNRKIPIYNRFKHSLLFGLIAVLPFCLWIIRCRLVSHTNIDYPLCIQPDLLSQIVIRPLEDITAWLVTAELQLPGRLIIIGIFLSILISAEIIKRHKMPHHFQDMKIAQVSVIFSLVYAFFITTAAAIVKADSNERMWSPLFVFLILLILIGIEAVARLLDRFLKNPSASNLLLSGIISLWLLFYCLPVFRQTASFYHRYGVPGVNSSLWRNAPLTNWLENHRLDGVFFSDAPDTLYFLHRISAELTPDKADDITVFRKKLSSQKTNYLIWYSMDYYRFSRSSRLRMYSLKDLSAKFRLEPVIMLQDGGVFIIR